MVGPGLEHDPQLGALLGEATTEIDVSRKNRVFCNRNLRMETIEMIGFDMDYTIALYHQDRLEQLSIELTLQKLVDKHGYAPEIRGLPYDPRWAIRGLGGGRWEYGYFATPSGATQVGNRVAVGYDSGSARFLVVSVTDIGEPYVLLVDAGGEVRATAFPGREATPTVYAFDVGRPVCRADGETSRCVVPYTSGNFFLLSSNPVLQAGWLEVGLGVNEGVVLVDVSGPGVLGGHGLMDLASGSGGLRGVAGEQRFWLKDGEAAPVVENERLAGGDWPLRRDLPTIAPRGRSNHSS